MKYVLKGSFFVCFYLVLFFANLPVFLKAAPVTEGNSQIVSVNRLHTNAYYHFVTCFATSHLVQLDDASIWCISPKKQQIVLSWKPNDDIFIKRNMAYFGSYSYILYNRMTKEGVEANLKSIALPNPNPGLIAHMFRIRYIDFCNRVIQLDDNSLWFVNPSSAHFMNWKIGQRISVGVNNGWRTNDYPHIFINADDHNQPYVEVANQN